MHTNVSYICGCGVLWSASQVCLCTLNDAKWSIQRTTTRTTTCTVWNYACALHLLHLLHLLLANKLYHQRGRLGLEIANQTPSALRKVVDSTWFPGCLFIRFLTGVLHRTPSFSEFWPPKWENYEINSIYESTQYHLEQHHSHITWPTWPECHACSAGTFSRNFQKPFSICNTSAIQSACPNFRNNSNHPTWFHFSIEETLKKHGLTSRWIMMNSDESSWIFLFSFRPRSSVALSFLDCGCGDCHHQHDPCDGLDRAVDHGDIGQRSPANLFAPWISPQFSHHPPWNWISQIWQIPPWNSATPWPQQFTWRTKSRKQMKPNGNDTVKRVVAVDRKLLATAFRPPSSTSYEKCVWIDAEQKKRKTTHPHGFPASSGLGWTCAVRFHLWARTLEGFQALF